MCTVPDIALWKTCTEGIWQFELFFVFFTYFLALLISGVLDKMEYGCYCQWFDQVVKKDPPPIDLIGKALHFNLVSCMYG